MTQLTKTDLATQISTLLADNTAGDISASDVRSVFTDAKDSLVGGPASATDNAVARFDSTTGQLIQNSVVTIADTTGNMAGVGTLACGATTVTGALIVTANVTADGTVIFNNAAADKDFTIKKLTTGNAYVYDAGADTTTVNSASTTIEGAVVINEASGDFDTRIESNGNTHAVFVDASTDRVGIFTASPTVPLDVTGAILGSTTITAGTALASGTTNTAGTYFLNSVGNALTAAGTDRATALQLAKGVNNVTTAAASTGVVLPVGVVGMQIIIENAGANPIKVYASASETIDTVAGATGVTLTNAKRCMYLYVAANTWISAQLGVVSA